MDIGDLRIVAVGIFIAQVAGLLGPFVVDDDHGRPRPSAGEALRRYAGKRSLQTFGPPVSANAYRDVGKVGQVLAVVPPAGATTIRR